MLAIHHIVLLCGLASCLAVEETSLVATDTSPACYTRFDTDAVSKIHQLERRIQVRTDHLEYMIQIHLNTPSGNSREHAKFGAIARTLFVELHHEIGLIAAERIQHLHVYACVDQLTAFLRYKFDRIHNLIETLSRVELFEAEIDVNAMAVRENEKLKQAAYAFREHASACNKKVELLVSGYASTIVVLGAWTLGNTAVAVLLCLFQGTRRATRG